MKGSILDYLPSYPDIDDPKLSYEILRRKEFNDLQLGPTEEIPTTTDTPLTTQKIESRAFNPHTPYPGEIIFAEPGTGKTCTTEFIIDTFLNSPHFRALIISPGEVLLKNFAKDIAKKCATSKFTVKFEGSILEKKRGSALSKCEKKPDKKACISELLKAGEEKASTKKVIKTYDMKAFNEIFVAIRKMKDEEIKAHYSHRIIFIDEAHLLRNEENAKEKYYDDLLRLVEVAEGTRLFLLTGTPIWDKTEDLASLINLFLKKKDRLKTGYEFNRTYITKDNKLNPSAIPALRKAFHGRVSFLRSLSSTARRDFIGVTSPWMKYMTIFPVAMSGFQKKTTKRLETEEKDLDTGLKSKSREASNFVGPDYKMVNGELVFIERNDVIVPLYGSEFYNKVIIYDKDTGYKYVSQEYLETISTNLIEYSTKLSFIADYSDENPNEVMWIYNKSVKTGSGVINDALLLAALKNGKKPRFLWAKTIEDLKRPSNIPKFIVISSELGTFNTAEMITKALEIVSSPENKYGKLCKMIFGTKKGVLGLTIKNARCAIIKYPHWNTSEIDQALARTLRVGSAANFEDENERYLKVFLLASVKADAKTGLNKGKGYPKDVAFSKDKTIDVVVYETAEKKDYISKQFYRLMKEGAWNCAVNYERNVLATDTEGSRFADYTTVNYRCEGFPEENIDKSGKVWKYKVPSNQIIASNYNTFYGVNFDLLENLRVLFRNYGCLKLEDIRKLVTAEELVLLGTLKYIIEKNLEIKDRFGFIRYLEEDSDVYFLKESQNKTSFYDSYYTNNPIINEPLKITDVVEHFQLEADKDLVEKFCSKKGGDFVKFLNTLHYKTKVVLIEQLALDDLKKAMEMFPSNIFQTKAFAWHNFYQIESKGIGYATKPKALIRILDGNEWRYIQSDWEFEQTKETQTVELLPFNEEFSNKLQLFATVDSSGFKIKDMSKTKQNSAGTTCTFIKIDVLLSIIWTLHINGSKILQEKATNPKVLKKYESEGLKGIRNALEELKTDVALSSVYGGKVANIPKASEENKNVLMMMMELTVLKKNKLCEFIRKWFEKEGLVKLKA